MNTSKLGLKKPDVGNYKHLRSWLSLCLLLALSIWSHAFLQTMVTGDWQPLIAQAQSTPTPFTISPSHDGVFAGERYRIDIKSDYIADSYDTNGVYGTTRVELNNSTGKCEWVMYPKTYGISGPMASGNPNPTTLAYGTLYTGKNFTAPSLFTPDTTVYHRIYKKKLSYKLVYDLMPNATYNGSAPQCTLSVGLPGNNLSATSTEEYSLVDSVQIDYFPPRNGWWHSPASPTAGQPMSVFYNNNNYVPGTGKYGAKGITDIGGGRCRYVGYVNRYAISSIYYSTPGLIETELEGMNVTSPTTSIALTAPSDISGPTTTSKRYYGYYQLQSEIREFDNVTGSCSSSANAGTGSGQNVTNRQITYDYGYTNPANHDVTIMNNPFTYVLPGFSVRDQNGVNLTGGDIAVEWKAPVYGVNINDCNKVIPIFSRRSYLDSAFTNMYKVKQECEDVLQPNNADATVTTYVAPTHPDGLLCVNPTIQMIGAYGGNIRYNCQTPPPTNEVAAAARTLDSGSSLIMSDEIRFSFFDTMGTSTTTDDVEKRFFVSNDKSQMAVSYSWLGGDFVGSLRVVAYANADSQSLECLVAPGQTQAGSSTRTWLNVVDGQSLSVDFQCLGSTTATGNVSVAPTTYVKDSATTQAEKPLVTWSLSDCSVNSSYATHVDPNGVESAQLLTSAGATNGNYNYNGPNILGTHTIKIHCGGTSTTPLKTTTFETVNAATPTGNLQAMNSSGSMSEGPVSLPAGSGGVKTVTLRGMSLQNCASPKSWKAYKRSNTTSPLNSLVQNTVTFNNSQTNNSVETYELHCNTSYTSSADAIDTVEVSVSNTALSGGLYFDVDEYVINSAPPGSKPKMLWELAGCSPTNGTISYDRPDLPEQGKHDVSDGSGSIIYNEPNVLGTHEGRLYCGTVGTGSLEGWDSFETVSSGSSCSVDLGTSSNTINVGTRPSINWVVMGNPADSTSITIDSTWSGSNIEGSNYPNQGQANDSTVGSAMSITYTTTADCLTGPDATDSVTITVGGSCPASPSVTIDPTVIPYGESVNVTRSPGGYLAGNCTWSPAGTYEGGSADSPAGSTYRFDNAGNYSMTYSCAQNGCSGSDSETITVTNVTTICSIETVTWPAPDGVNICTGKLNASDTYVPAVPPNKALVTDSVPDYTGSSNYVCTTSGWVQSGAQSCGYNPCTGNVNAIFPNNTNTITVSDTNKPSLTWNTSGCSSPSVIRRYDNRPGGSGTDGYPFAGFSGTSVVDNGFVNGIVGKVEYRLQRGTGNTADILDIDSVNVVEDTGPVISGYLGVGPTTIELNSGDNPYMTSYSQNCSDTRLYRDSTQLSSGLIGTAVQDLGFDDTVLGEVEYELWCGQKDGAAPAVQLDDSVIVTVIETPVGDPSGTISVTDNTINQWSTQKPVLTWTTESCSNPHVLRRKLTTTEVVTISRLVNAENFVDESFNSNDLADYNYRLVCGSSYDSSDVLGNALVSVVEASPTGYIEVNGQQGVAVVDPDENQLVKWSSDDTDFCPAANSGLYWGGSNESREMSNLLGITINASENHYNDSYYILCNNEVVATTKVNKAGAPFTITSDPESTLVRGVTGDANNPINVVVTVDNGFGGLGTETIKVTSSLPDPVKNGVRVTPSVDTIITIECNDTDADGPILPVCSTTSGTANNNEITIQYQFEVTDRISRGEHKFIVTGTSQTNSAAESAESKLKILNLVEGEVEEF